MDIFLNNEKVTLPSEVKTVETLVKWKNIPLQGTAIALNNKIVRKESWSLTKLNQLDRIMIITAAFGG